MSIFDRLRKIAADAEHARHERELQTLAMKIMEYQIVEALEMQSPFIKCVNCKVDLFIRDPAGLDTQKEMAEHIYTQHHDLLEKSLIDYKNTVNNFKNLKEN